MFRFTAASLALSSLLCGCAAAPGVPSLAPTPSRPAPSLVAPTLPSSILVYNTGRDVDAIDAAAAKMTPEIQQDREHGMTFTAYRAEKTIRKIVVDRDSPSEVSTTRFYFTTQGALFFVDRSGGRYERAPKTGRITKVSSLETSYYIHGDEVAAFSAMYGGAPVEVSADDARGLHADAESALSRFSH